MKPVEESILNLPFVPEKYMRQKELIFSLYSNITIEKWRLINQFIDDFGF